jgi:hypothetical protein
VQRTILKREKIQNDIAEVEDRIKDEAMEATASLKRALQEEDSHFQQLESRVGHLPGTRLDVIKAAPQEQLFEAMVAERFLCGKYTLLRNVGVTAG